MLLTFLLAITKEVLLMKYIKLNPESVGYSMAIICGACTFLIALLGHLGQMLSGKLAEQLFLVVTITNPFYIFNLTTISGMFLGTIEAVIFWFLLGYAFAWLYNRFA